MTDFITADALPALLQVVLIDLVLAGDNAIVIGLAAAGLAAEQRRRATLVGSWPPPRFALHLPASQRASHLMIGQPGLPLGRAQA